MPQIRIEHGFGPEIQNYLNYRTRRGEEMRRLQFEADALEAKMRARQAETRTRILSGAIDQGIGLYAGEKIKDRAAERGLETADKMQFLKGRPAMRQANLALGITEWDSKTALIDHETGIGAMKSRITLAIQNSPNMMTPEQDTLYKNAQSEMQEYHAAMSKNGTDEANYVRAMLGALESITFAPAGPPKEKFAPNTVIGTGTGPGGNGIPKGILATYDKNGEPKIFETGYEDTIRERMATIRTVPNPEYDIWKDNDDPDKGDAPPLYLSYKDAMKELMNDVVMQGILTQVAQGTIPEDDLAEWFASRLDPDPGADGDDTEQVSAAIAQGGPVPFDGIERKVLDQLVKQTKDGKIRWPDPIQRNGKWYVAYYVGDDKMELEEIPPRPASRSPQSVFVPKRQRRPAGAR